MEHNIFGVIAFIAILATTIILTRAVKNKKELGLLNRFLKDVPASAVFWNGMYWTVFMTIVVISPEIGAILSLIGTIFLCVCVVDNGKLKHQTWPVSTFGFCDLGSIPGETTNVPTLGEGGVFTTNDNAENEC